MFGEMVKQKDRMLEMYWKCKGKVQGDIKGSVDTKGFEGWSRVFGISWGVAGPVDQQTGERTGKRVLEALIITKPVDKMTTFLMTAMINNEVIDASEFTYLDVPGAATAVQKMVRVFTIKTDDGFISKIEAGSTPEGVLIERIHLFFDKITCRHEIATTEAADERVVIT